MTIEQILALGQMGYTKADIDALGAAPESQPKEEPRPARTQEEPKEEEKPLMSADDILKALGQQMPEQKPAEPSNVTMTTDQFNELIQNIRLNGASLDVPAKTNLQDALVNHTLARLGGLSSESSK